MTEKNALLKDITAIVNQCDRCGSCHLVCPLFTVDDREACGPRGKVSAARTLTHSGIASEADVLEAVDYCLLCGACTDVCASKVKTPDAMRKVREYLAHVSKKTVGLSNEEKAKLEQAFTTLCDEADKLTGNGSGTDNRVAYFFGCTARLASPETAFATIARLQSVAAVDLVNNACCGLPALTRGQVEDFKETLKDNIQLYEDASTIVCDCAGCGDTLKKAAVYLSNDPEWSEKAKAFSQKVVSLSELLAKSGYTPRKQVEKITYHEPCRLGRGQGVKKQPRELLKLSGNFVELPGADVCCGGSCFFPTDYPQASETLVAKKLANIEKTGAKLVVTECHRCLIQLKKAAEKSGKFRAAHISEVI